MEDNRKYPRCAIHWRSAIVVEENGRRETIQCKTYDISIVGVSVICHRNISPRHGITVYLLIDPGNQDRPQVVVEAQGEIMNSVLSGQQGGFRLGIQFKKFAGDGKQVLLKHLPKELSTPAKRIPAAKATPAAEAVPTVNDAPAADEAPDADAPGSDEEAAKTDEEPVADEAPAIDEAPNEP